jgi:hypothetical protein
MFGSKKYMISQRLEMEYYESRVTEGKIPVKIGTSLCERAKRNTRQDRVKHLHPQIRAY